MGDGDRGLGPVADTPRREEVGLRQPASTRKAARGREDGGRPGEVRAEGRSVPDGGLGLRAVAGS